MSPTFFPDQHYIRHKHPPLSLLVSTPSGSHSAQFPPSLSLSLPSFHDVAHVMLRVVVVVVVVDEGEGVVFFSIHSKAAGARGSSCCSQVVECQHSILPWHRPAVAPQSRRCAVDVAAELCALLLGDVA